MMIDKDFTYKVGVYQFCPKHLDIEYNLNKIEKALQNVQADLIVLPELATTGYVYKDRKELMAYSQEIKGETIAWLKNLAKKNNCSYIMGFAEKDKDKLYNSAVLVNPNQEFFVYRKTHLFYEEKLIFDEGNTGFEVFVAKGGVKVGIIICFDWIFPEAIRTLALKNADIICQSANLVMPYCQTAMITRALENRIYCLTANRVGKEKDVFFTGESQIVSYNGQIIAKLGIEEEKVLLSEIKFSDKKLNKLNDLFEDRRKEYYKI